MTQPRKHRRSRRRKRQGSLAFLYRLLTFVLICGAIVAALSLFFKAEQIFVTGTSRYSQQQVLQAIGKDEAWLREQLETEGISDPADVFLCLWQKNGFFVLKKTAQNPAEMQHGRHQHPAD